MNERNRDAQTRKLQALYREAGDVEPDSGLDRIIRARADQASRDPSHDPSHDRRPAGRLPWLGGLVTASVAIIAIAVVLQQTPPGEPLPESLAPLRPGEPEAFMAPSMGAQSQQEVSEDAIRARSETGAEEDASPQSPRAPAREALLDAASESRPPPAVQAEAEPAAANDAEESTLERITITGSRLGNAHREVLKSGGDLIETLRELIEADRIDDARRLLDEAMERDPGLELPEDIELALSRPHPYHQNAEPDSGRR